MTATSCLIAACAASSAPTTCAWSFLGASLDHHDAIACASDDQVERALLALRVGGVDVLVSLLTIPTRTPATVFSNGISEMASAAESTGDGQHVGVVFGVSGHQERDDLRLEAPAGWEQQRIGRSISRLVSTSFSAALPSRLKNPPGMRPDA